SLEMDAKSSGFRIERYDFKRRRAVSTDKNELLQGLSRRTVLRAGMVSAMAVGLGGLMYPDWERGDAHAAEVGPSTGAARRDQAFQVREDAAQFQHQLPIAVHPDNG